MHVIIIGLDFYCKNNREELQAYFLISKQIKLYLGNLRKLETNTGNSKPDNNAF